MTVRPWFAGASAEPAARVVSDMRIDVPAEGSFVRPVRLLVGDAASRAGFGFDEIEDLRLAITESYYGILSTEATVLSVRVQLGPGCIVASGHVDAGFASEPDLHAMTSFVVDLVCDRWILDTSGERASFWFEKRARR